MSFNSISISINNDRCLGCSLCIKDCPTGALYLDNNKAVPRNSGCIECGHCFAICPVNAVSMNGYDMNGCNEIGSMTDINSEKLLLAMKSRRTIRHFKADPVEQEKLDMILEAGRYSPTAANSQNVAYTVLGSKQREIEDKCISLFRSGQKLASPFVEVVKNVHIDDNFFFKGAPLVIVVSGKDDVNAGLASSYMELAAESMGLGVLYSGFFVVCSKLNPKIKSILKLPKGHKVVSCMIIGYPNVEYKRIAPRKPLNVKIL
ncbi:MAG: nitroreductase family protein [Eubacterium sp.]